MWCSIFFLGCKNNKSWSLELQVLKVPGFQRDPLQPPCNRFFGSNLPGSTLVWQHISDGVWILHATRDSSNLRMLVVLVSFLSPPLATLCVCVWVCEWALSLSASPGEAWSFCSVFFTSLAIFSSHCESLHILGSGSQLCGPVNVMKHLSTFFRRRKLIKTPSISIMSSPQKTMAILGVSMWFWGDESWMRSRWGDAESFGWTENTFSLLYSPFNMPALAAGKKLWPYFGQSFQIAHIKRLASLCLLCRPIPTALLCLAETAHIYLGPTTKREEGPPLNTRKGKLQILPQKKVMW